MPRKLNRALVRGRDALWWDHSNGVLILRDRSSRAETEVPVRHLTDERELQQHVARLTSKAWVQRAAIDELLEIAAGARG